MALRLKRKKKTVSVSHKGATFEVEPMSATKESKLSEQYTQFIRRTGQEKTDHVGLVKERFRSMVDDWNGIVDEDSAGNLIDIECTDENKESFVEENFSEAIEILAKAKDKAEEVAQVEYENLKNS